MPRITKLEVRQAFAGFPEELRERLLAVRELIYEVAAEDSEIGTVEESLRWGQPSYAVNTGTPVRLGVHSTERGECALYVHCQTTLIEGFRRKYGSRSSARAPVDFDGNRALVFRGKKLPVRILRECIRAALTYRRR